MGLFINKIILRLLSNSIKYNKLASVMRRSNIGVDSKRGSFSKHLTSRELIIPLHIISFERGNNHIQIMEGSMGQSTSDETNGDTPTIGRNKSLKQKKISGFGKRAALVIESQKKHLNIDNSTKKMNVLQREEVCRQIFENALHKREIFDIWYPKQVEEFYSKEKEEHDFKYIYPLRFKGRTIEMLFKKEG